MHLKLILTSYIYFCNKKATLLKSTLRKIANTFYKFLSCYIPRKR